MRPLLKWVGGKTQLLSEVFALFPETIRDYYEPFVGGGSVLLHLLASGISVRTIYASDTNPILINFYKAVQSNVEELIVCLTSIQTEYTNSANKEEFYYEMRTLFNATPHDSVDSAARFLFLNKTCFRGVYREGPRGFNVPFGHYKSTEFFDESEVRKFSEMIRRVVFTCESFETALKKPKKGDFVYADPPYVPEKATSFVGYVADGFSKHKELFDMLRGLPCEFVMSNSNVPLVVESFPEYTIKKVEARRAIHSKDPGSRTIEVLITKSSQGIR